MVQIKFEPGVRRPKLTNTAPTARPRAANARFPATLSPGFTAS